MTFIVPIDEFHGKLRGNFGAAQRANANNAGERKPYSTYYGKRKTEPSDEEKAAWTKFGNIGKLVQIRLKDESKIAADQAAFKAQSTYKTMFAYLWHTIEATYSA